MAKGLIANDYVYGRSFEVHEPILSFGMGLKLRSDGKVELSGANAKIDFLSKTTSHSKVDTNLYRRGDGTWNTPNNMERIACAPLAPGSAYNVWLTASHDAITIGDPIMAAEDGRFTVAPSSPTGGENIIGIALESREANDGVKTDGKEYIKVLCKPFMIPEPGEE